MTHEAWVETHDIAKVESGPRPATVVLTFYTSESRDVFVRSLCNGFDVKGGGVRHDDGKRCVVHGSDHDGWTDV